MARTRRTNLFNAQNSGVKRGLISFVFLVFSFLVICFTSGCVAVRAIRCLAFPFDGSVRTFRSHVIYASDYGVVANDRTDCARELQAAIDALPAHGGVLQLPSGRIKLSQTIYIRRPFVTMQGVGPGTQSKYFDRETGRGTKLVFTRAIDGLRISPAENANAKTRLGGITLRDFGIVGSGTSNKAIGIRSELLPGNASIFGPTDDLLIERVSITEYATAMRLCRNDITKVINCWPTECGNGIAIDGGFYVMITNTCIADNPGYGISVKDLYGGAFVGNIIVRNRASLVVQGNTHDVIFTANVVLNDHANKGIVEWGDLLTLGDGVRRTLFSANAFTTSMGGGFSISEKSAHNEFAGNVVSGFDPNYGLGHNWVDGWSARWSRLDVTEEWSGSVGAADAPRARVSKDGTVCLRGIIRRQENARSNVVLVLPAGFLPTSTRRFPVAGWAGEQTSLGVLCISNNGEASLEGLAGAEFVEINCTFNRK